MKKIIIKNQKQFNKIKEVKKDEEIIFESPKIEINCILNVFGILRLKGEIKSSWDNKFIKNLTGEVHIESRESSQNHIESRESSQNHIVSWESSQNHIESRESSQNHIVSRESSQNHIVSWESSQNHIESWESSQNHIVSRESSQNHIVSWESSQNHIVSFNFSINTVINFVTSIILNGFSVVMIPIDLKIKIKKSKDAKVQRYKQEPYLVRECVEVKNGKVILYKRVSKDYKTQEGKENETEWKIGTTVTHKNWKPEAEECSAGKFHAVSRPFFADEFRNNPDDKYIAVEIKVEDLYEWKNNPQYPHKIAFREGKVLFECDKYGKEIIKK